MFTSPMPDTTRSQLTWPYCFASQSDKATSVSFTGCEVRVPALAGKRDIALSIPTESCLAEAGARRDHGGITIGHRFAGIENTEVVYTQHGDTPGDRLEIVDQADIRPAIVGPDLFGIDHPGQVGRLANAVPDRPGHAETGNVGNSVGRGEIFIQDIIERAEITGAEPAIRLDLRIFGFQIDNAEAGLCPADITG